MTRQARGRRPTRRLEEYDESFATQVPMLNAHVVPLGEQATTKFLGHRDAAVFASGAADRKCRETFAFV